MKSVVFDTGPIISLSLNSLLWVLKRLKKQFDGEFIIPEGVKRELVDRPLQIKRFKFEALRVSSYIDRGILKIIDQPKVQQNADYLLDTANHIFKTHGRFISIVHHAEMEVIAAALLLNSSVIVIDERTTRVLIEDPFRAKEMLQKKLHADITVNQQNLEKFRKEVKGMKVIRSTELVTMAFELGMLNEYLPKMEKPKKHLLESVLWGVKLNGCAVTREEIDYLVAEETEA